jgi:hypothetical protein
MRAHLVEGCRPLFDLSGTGAPSRRREPEDTFGKPVPIVGRIVWADDGEEQVETVALGWTGREAYVRMSHRRYELKAVWAQRRRCHMTMTVDERRMTRARIRDEFIAHDIQRSTATPDALTRTRRPASSLGCGPSRTFRCASPG